MSFGNPQSFALRQPRFVDIKLYVDTMVGGAFEFVPPMTSDNLDHILACTVGGVSNLWRTQAMGVAV